MRYRIEYADGQCCKFADGRQDLMKMLKLIKSKAVTDIRKVYKNGVSDSVMETYKPYLK